MLPLKEKGTPKHPRKRKKIIKPTPSPWKKGKKRRRWISRSGYDSTRVLFAPKKVLLQKHLAEKRILLFNHNFSIFFHFFFRFLENESNFLNIVVCFLSFFISFLFFFRDIERQKFPRDKSQDYSAQWAETV